ncbi:hypothetical protein Emag_006379 [Eimeria magna]
MHAKESCTPECLWAERKDFIFLTVQVPSPEDLQVDLKETSLDVSCSKGAKHYACHLDFPEPINVEESKYSTQRNVQFKLVKKEPKRWHRVTTGDKKLHWLKCDWNKWVDSDEEENSRMDMGDFDMESMGFGGMGGMGGMGGLDLNSLGGGGGFGDMGDMGDSDDDDEDLKDLDSAMPEDDAAAEDKTKENATEQKPPAEAES